MWQHPHGPKVRIVAGDVGGLGEEGAAGGAGGDRVQRGPPTNYMAFQG